MHGNNDESKFKKSLLKYKTEYNKNKNCLTSLIQKNIQKIKEEKDEISQNKSNKNIIHNHKNLKLKKI